MTTPTRHHHPALRETMRLWRTVRTGCTEAHADEHAEIRAVLRAVLASHGHAPERTGAEWAEFRAWCDALPGYLAMLHTPTPVFPTRKGSDSATRAGTLARGQWRGVPVLPRGAPFDAVDTPRVSGYLWAMLAAMAERGERRADKADAVHRDKCHAGKRARQRATVDRTTEELRRKVRQCIRRMNETSAELGAAIAALRAKLGQ